MTVFHQEVGAVLLGSDRVRGCLGHALDDLHSGDVKLETAMGALVGADFAFDDHAGFLGQGLDGVEHFGRDGVFRNDALDDSRAIAELRK